MDYDEILPQLFVGSCPENTSDIDRLKADGITAVVNLQSDDDCEDLNLSWPDLHAHYDAVGIEVCRIRIQDFDDTDLLNHLPVASQQLDQLIKTGHKTLVHCTAGINRSPSVVICHLLWNEKWELDDAVRHVSERRYCSPGVSVIKAADSEREQGESGP